MTNYDMDELRRRDDEQRKKDFGKDIVEHEKRGVHDTRTLG